MSQPGESGPNNFVSWISSSRGVTLENVTAEFVSALRLAGIQGQHGGSQYVISIANDDQQLATLLSTLRDLGALFMGHHSGWPPSAIFEDLRERGLLQGQFTEVMWRGPGKWFTTVR